MKLAGRILMIWTVETVFNAFAGAIWMSCSKYNSEPFHELFWGSLLLYISIKAVFHLIPYWIAYYCFSANQPESITYFIGFQSTLFSIVSLFAGGIFAWNIFYNDWTQAILLISSSALAATVFAFTVKRRRTRLFLHT
jgi:hypothetical protein